MKRASSLSTRLLVLTVLFVVGAEILVFFPSVSRFRVTYLENHISSAHLASLALQATGDNLISKGLEKQMLETADVLAVTVKRADTRMIMFQGDRPPAVTDRIDLRGTSYGRLLVDAVKTMLFPRDGNAYVIAPLPGGKKGEILEIILMQRPLWQAMVAYAGRVFGLTIVISLFTALLVYGTLNGLLVRPMREITESMVNFRQRPEDASRIIAPSGRQDEIGIARYELAAMQNEIRSALQHKTRLANLGASVSRINHDLRNSLASAQLVSDRLAGSQDPAVRNLVPRLVRALDRAISLCRNSLKYGRVSEPPPRRLCFELMPLLDDIRTTIGIDGDTPVGWQCRVAPDFEIDADPEQLYRIIFNLCRNAVQALAGQDGGGALEITARRRDGMVTIDIADNGPGLPRAARDHLFEPFAGSARAGGTGLGLAIARELAGAHGGDVAVLHTGPEGTCFRISIPDRA